jgi:hypothetical protein
MIRYATELNALDTDAGKVASTSEDVVCTVADDKKKIKVQLKANQNKTKGFMKVKLR